MYNFLQKFGIELVPNSYKQAHFTFRGVRYYADFAYPTPTIAKQIGLLKWQYIDHKKEFLCN